MLIRFTCRACSARLETEASNAGSRIPCPSCGTSLEVPPAVVGPGTTIAGFRIERLIGEGGMGRVFLARQLSMDRPVALKILPAAIAADPRMAERFIQEVRLTARLDHPHLVTAYEAGQDDGVLFFAMAYVNGRTLHDRLMKEGALSETEALCITLKVAQALAYAWQEHQLLHRDIKPANILLDTRGEPKLADLGLARTLNELDSGWTLPGTIVGTPNYMSPEAAEGRPLDVRSDIYSLGATLWTMLTARVPFDGEPLVGVLRKQAMEPYPDVRAWNPSVSPETCALLDRMLAKDPRHRFASWEEVIRAIAQALGTAAPPPDCRLLVPLIGIPLLLLTLLVLVAIRLMGSPRRSEPIASPPIPEPTTTPSPTGAGEADPLPSGSSSSPVMSGVPTFLPDEPRDAPVREEERPLAWLEAFEEGRAWLERILAYGRVHSEDRTGIIARLREGSRRRAGSPAAPFARVLADHFAHLWSPPHDLGSILARLRREARIAMEHGDYEGLIRRFSEYDGLFKEETEAFRQAWIAEARAALERSQLRQQIEETTLERAHSAAAGALFRGDRQAAVEQWRRLEVEASARALKTPFGSLVEEAETLPDPLALILDAFRAQRGQKVTVEFKDGRTDSLRIISIGPAAIRAQRELPEGFIEIEFTPAQLHPRDLWGRLGTFTTPAARIVRGLFAVEHQQWEAAAAEFEAAGTPLGDLLAEEAKKRTRSRPPASP